MKKTAILTTSLAFFFVASYAQDTKMPTTPAYDNVNKEKEWNLQKIPSQQAKYALIDENNDSKAENKFISMPVNRVNLLDPEIYKTNSELTHYDIKKVTFPKNKKTGF